MDAQRVFIIRLNLNKDTFAHTIGTAPVVTNPVKTMVNVTYESLLTKLSFDN